MISATLELSCGGCDATLTVRGRYIRNRTRVGTERPTLVIDPDPTDEWVWFDPYTNAQYCPTCWASIEAS